MIHVDAGLCDICTVCSCMYLCGALVTHLSVVVYM